MKDNPTPLAARALSTSDAARYLGLSESFLEKARVNQTVTPGPRATKIGKRVVYLREDLDRFLENPPNARSQIDEAANDLAKLTGPKTR